MNNTYGLMKSTPYQIYCIVDGKRRYRLSTYELSTIVFDLYTYRDSAIGAKRLRIFRTQEGFFLTFP